jgi:hypothetical protein
MTTRLPTNAERDGLGFTPGPWRIERNGDGAITSYYGADKKRVDAAVGSGRREITEANARLIVAAPDLYEALQLVLDTYGFDSSTDSSIWQTVCAALAKARGQA